MKVKKEGLTAATRKPAGSDWFVMPMMSAGFFGAMIVSGLSHRYGWSSVPILFKLIGLLLSNAGLVLMNIAILQNAFASKFLDINKGQVLIDTGLYGHIRHPLYAGACLMILTLPIALDSWFGVFPALLGVLSLVIRITFEEEMLVKGMEGYVDYQSRVKYKLIPKIY